MKDSELRLIVLQKYYEKREEYYVHVNKDFLGDKVAIPTILRISEQLQQKKLIEFNPLRGDDRIVAGVGRITQKGTDLIEEMQQSSQPHKLNYKLNRIRNLLTEGFSYEELHRFCYDNQDFRKVCNQLSPEMGKDKVIDRIIQYAEQKSQFEILLSWAKEYNSIRYEEFSPYQDKITTNSPYEEPKEVKLSPEQKELLIAAAQTGEFHLIDVQEAPTWVRVGGKDFHDDKDPAVAVIFRDAFRELCKDGYINKESGIHRLTGSGFKIARRLANIK